MASLLGDPFMADDSSTFASRLSLEKSNFLRTDAVADPFLGSTGPRLGDEYGPREGFLFGGDCRNVLIGVFALGGGSRMFARRSVRTSVGSGIVPIKQLIVVFILTVDESYFHRHPCLPHWKLSHLLY